MGDFNLFMGLIDLAMSTLEKAFKTNFEILELVLEWCTMETVLNQETPFKRINYGLWRLLH